MQFSVHRDNISRDIERRRKKIDLLAKLHFQRSEQQSVRSAHIPKIGQYILSSLVTSKKNSSLDRWIKLDPNQA